MNAGDRDREIVLERADVSRDSTTGETILIWPPDGGSSETLYAEWLPGNSRESINTASRLSAYIDGVFRIEFVDRPDPATSRILFDGRYYDVKPPIEIQRGIGWELPVIAKAEGA